MALKDILVIDTGGTFSMKYVNPGAEDEILVVAEHIEVLHELKSLASEFHYVEAEGPSKGLVRRESDKDQWYYYPLAERIDSSAATPHHWHKIAKLIHEKRHDFDAFVVIHGTDTLMYVSAGLSFLLPKFPKPIIVTGAQVPLLAKSASDAANNFLGSLAFAASTKKVTKKGDKWPKVCCLSGVFVYFDTKLMLGVAAVKVDSRRWSAFDSPRTHLVGELMEGKPVIFRPQDAYMTPVGLSESELEKYKLLSLAPETDPLPLIVHLFPGIKLENFQLEKYDAVILAAYGSGNGPTDMKDCLTKYLNGKDPETKGGLVAVVSECLSGKTSAAYQACIESWDLRDGVSRIATCLDTSLPAAFAKTCVRLGRYSEKPPHKTEVHSDFKDFMGKSLVGELIYESLEECQAASKPQGQ